MLFDRQRFDDPTGGGTLSFARFSSAAVKTDDQSVVWVSKYDVVSRAPSPASSAGTVQGLDQVPLGNGDATLGVWSQSDGKTLALIAV